jgi:hypothetical protein
MGAKRIQVSADGGTTYRTLPGSSGDYREEMATVNDTIFGQDFESNEVSIGQWGVSANSYFKGVPGYIANLKQQGTATTMTAEPMALVSGKTYRITNAVRRILDYFSPITVFDGGVDHTADVVSIDYLNGEVTFAAAYTVSGAVTLTGKYVPTVSIAKARTFTLTQSAAELDTTVYEEARANDGWRTFKYGLRTVGLDIGGVYDVTNGFAAALRSRDPIMVEVAPANDALTFFRGFFKFHNRGQQGDVGALEEENRTLGLWVPDGALVVRPFGWYFDPSSTLNLAVRETIAAWQAKTTVKVRYQDDPDIAGSGHVGDAIVSEATLSNSFEGLNEFRFGFRGTGAPSTV